MTLLFYAAAAIVVVNVFAALIYYCLHRGVGLAISLVGTILIAMGLTYASLNDVPASKPAPDITTPIETTPTTPEQPHTVHPSLDPSNVSRETPAAPTTAATSTKSPAYTQKKAPVHRRHFDDMEKKLSHADKGTDPGAGGCDDIAAGGCK